MRKSHLIKTSLVVVSTWAAVFLASPHLASAHCDTLDGPVIQDARKAISAKEITPVLKWVKPQDEDTVRSAFQKLLTGTGHSEAAEHEFFATLVKIHRAGEGAPYTGLKPAGAVEPAVAEADQALLSGSPDALVKLVTDDVAAGIRERYEHAAATYTHKDESVTQGRDFVEAYVSFTHYVERLHQDAGGQAGHGEHAGHDMHQDAGHDMHQSTGHDMHQGKGAHSQH